jgi:hypothetical protein
MKQGMTWLGAALAVATAVALLLAGGGDAQTKSRTITFFEQEDTFTFVDNPPRSPVANPGSPRARLSQGDQGYSTGALRDRRGGKRIGEVYVTSAVMSGTRYPHVTDVTHAIFTFDDGQIVVAGVADQSRPKSIRGAVVGGTGAYLGASGTFTTEPGKGGSRDTLRLNP